MDPKPQPNHDQYLRVLHGMRPSERAMKAFELSELSRQLFIQGLRKRFPDLSEKDFHKLLLDRLALCHNTNY